MIHPSQEKYAPKIMIWWKKNLIRQIFHKKNQKVLIKIDEMADVFLNLANIVQNALLTFSMPPTSYTLNLNQSIDQGLNS